MPGITPEQVGSFYEAAIKVECDKFESGPWYAVLMGQSGLKTGLALYEALKALRGMGPGGADEDDARQLVRNTGLPESARVGVGTDHTLADPELLAAMLGACKRGAGATSW